MAVVDGRELSRLGDGLKMEARHDFIRGKLPDDNHRNCRILKITQSVCIALAPDFMSERIK
jgi:hypothetical protein